MSRSLPFRKLKPAALAGLAAWALPETAQAQGPVGDPCLVAQIVRLNVGERRGGIRILSPARSGRRGTRDARLRECLRPGEEVRVIAPDPAFVKVRLPNETVTLTARDPPLTIPERQEPGFWDRFASFVRSFRIFTGTPEVAVVETFGRRRGLGEVRHHPNLPPGEQLMPRGQTTLTILWEGPDALVELDNASGQIVGSVWNAPGNRVDFEGLSLDGHFELSVANRLNYQIATVDAGQIPEPDWMDGRNSRSEDERLARALWILTDGPPVWRLFAVDELHRLQATSFAAERVWEWVREAEASNGNVLQ